MCSVIFIILAIIHFSLSLIIWLHAGLRLSQTRNISLDLNSPRLWTLIDLQFFIVCGNYSKLSMSHVVTVNSIIQKIVEHIFLSFYWTSFPWGRGADMLQCWKLLIFLSVILFFPLGALDTWLTSFFEFSKSGLFQTQYIFFAWKYLNIHF